MSLRYFIVALFMTTIGLVVQAAPAAKPAPKPVAKTTATTNTNKAAPAQQTKGATTQASASNKAKTEVKKPQEPMEKGYRGMADMGFSLGIGGGKGFNRFGFSTTHGYQVVPKYLFLGGGLAVDYYSDGSGAAVPLYFDMRVNFPAKVSPFIDARAGGSPMIIKGVYLSPSFGIRIPVKQTKYGFALMAGYTFQTGKFRYFKNIEEIVIEDKHKMGGVHFKFGFEW